MKKIMLFVVVILVAVSCQQMGGSKTKVAKIETIRDKVKDKDSIKQNPVGLEAMGLKPKSGEQSPADKAAATAFNAGIRYYKNGNFEDALKQFKIVIEKRPDYGAAFHYMGRIYYEKGQKELALSYYEDAARLNIDDSVSVLGIGQVYFDMGNNEKAMEYYNMSIDIAPGYGLAYYNRGTLLGMQNDYIKALDDLNKSIELDPDNGNAYVNRGLAYFYLKQMNSACRDWQKAADMGIKKAADAVEKYCK